MKWLQKQHFLIALACTGSLVSHTHTHTHTHTSYIFIYAYSRVSLSQPFTGVNSKYRTNPVFVISIFRGSWYGRFYYIYIYIYIGKVRLFYSISTCSTSPIGGYLVTCVTSSCQGPPDPFSERCDLILADQLPWRHISRNNSRRCRYCTNGIDFGKIGHNARSARHQAQSPRYYPTAAVGRWTPRKA